jgi:hypothetical protein
MKSKFDTNDARFGRDGPAWSRRQFARQFGLGLAVALSGWPRASDAANPPALDPALVKRFTRDGGGGYGGDSWGDAMPIEWLGRSLARAEPGSAFLIGFGPDKDEVIAFGGTRMLLQTSGSPDKPIVIQAGAIQPDAKTAADLQSAQRTLFRSSSEWSIATAPKSPQFFLALAKGASNVRMSGFRIDGTSADGFFKFYAKKGDEQTFSDIIFSDIQAANVGRVIETAEGSVLDHVSIVNCSAKGIVRGFARFRVLKNAVFKNLDLDADNFDGGGKNVCQIIAIENGENIEFENVTVKNAINEKDAGLRDHGAGYVQGDGIVTEANTKNIKIRKCHAEGMGDGGFDLKTTNVTIEDSSTRDCKFGVRIWSRSDNVISRGSFLAPIARGNSGGACVQALGTVDIHDSKFQAGNPKTAAFILERKKDPPVIRVFGGSIEISGDAVLAGGHPGAILELHDVAVNGTTRNERYVFSEENRAVK